ncbi:hypothetical protein G9A89_010057 [Geosiphon pyriformis]|nr:hypothetical protein G9A89_010057 [Geosiphon pyriformis]
MLNFKSRLIVLNLCNSRAFSYHPALASKSRSLIVQTFRNQFTRGFYVPTENRVKQKDKNPEAENLPRRFWEKVTLKLDESKGIYLILLDKRVLKTPGGVPLSIQPTKKTVAYLVAGEWESQKTVIKPHLLPLTSLVARAIDTFTDLHSKQREKAILRLLPYFDTDTICYQQPFPESLVELQTLYWNPVLLWAQQFYEVEIKTTHKIIGVRQPQVTKDKLWKVVDKFDPLKLAAFERAVMTSKSYLIGLGLVEKQFTAEQATQAAQVEMVSQTMQWGQIENVHDLEHEEIRRQLGSVACALITNDA